MRELEKLFRKISKKDRKLLLAIVEDIKDKEKSEHLDIKKLQGNDFYRVRKGKFRLIFHYDSAQNTVIDSIRIRNKGTYKGFN